MESGNNVVVQPEDTNMGEDPPGAQMRISEHPVTAKHFEAACEENREKLIRIGIHKGVDRNEAEDLVQEAILAVRGLTLQGDVLELARSWLATPENISRLKTGLTALLAHYLDYKIREYFRQRKKLPVSIADYWDTLVDCSSDDDSVQSTLVTPDVDCVSTHDALFVFGPGDCVLLNEEVARRAGLDERQIAYLRARSTRLRDREQDALPGLPASTISHIRKSCFKKLIVFLEWHYDEHAKTIHISRQK